MHAPARGGATIFSALLTLTGLTAAAHAGGADQSGGGTEPPLAVSGNIALVSDYRFRGLSLSAKDPALQGALTLAGGWGHLGVWGSSIESFNGAELELDATVGRSFTLSGLESDVGLIAYVFPGGRDTDYVEVYASTGGTVGTVSWRAGLNYAPDQRNIGGADSLYLFSGISVPLGRLPLRLDAGAGFEDGAFGDNKWDWHAGLAYGFYGFELSLRYVDARDDGRAISGTAVLSIARGF